MEQRESEFFQKVHHGPNGVARSSSAGGALGTYEPLDQRRRNMYLAPEYRAEGESEQPHHAMDWYAGLKHAPVHVSPKFPFHALKYAIFGHIA